MISIDFQVQRMRDLQPELECVKWGGFGYCRVVCVRIWLTVVLARKNAMHTVISASYIAKALSAFSCLFGDDEHLTI